MKRVWQFALFIVGISAMEDKGPNLIISLDADSIPDIGLHLDQKEPLTGQSFGKLREFYAQRGIAFPIIKMCSDNTMYDAREFWQLFTKNQNHNERHKANKKGLLVDNNFDMIFFDQNNKFVGALTKRFLEDYVYGKDRNGLIYIQNYTYSVPWELYQNIMGSDKKNKDFFSITAKGNKKPLPICFNNIPRLMFKAIYEKVDILLNNNINIFEQLSKANQGLDTVPEIPFGERNIEAMLFSDKFSGRLQKCGASERVHNLIIKILRASLTSHLNINILYSFALHTKAVHSLSIKKINTVAIGCTKSEDDTTQLWNANTGKVLAVFAGQDWEFESTDSTALLWDTDYAWGYNPAGDLTSYFAQDGQSIHAISREGDVVTSANNGGDFVVWRSGGALVSVPLAKDNKLFKRAHFERVQFSKDARYIVATVLDDNVIRIWNKKTGCLIKFLELDNHCSFFLISSDSSFLLVACQDGSLIKYYLDNDYTMSFKESPHEIPVTMIKLSKDNDVAATGDAEGNFALWNTISGERDVLSPILDNDIKMLKKKIVAFEFIAKNGICLECDDGSIYLWNVAKNFGMINLCNFKDKKYPGIAVAFPFLYASSPEGQICIFKLEKLLQVMNVLDDKIPLTYQQLGLLFSIAKQEKIMKKAASFLQEQ